MDFALGYLVGRFFYRIYDFFYHWYIDGSRFLGHKFIELLSGADQTIAFAITLRHFGEPLYKDYTIIGRILGIVFRTGRLLLGSVFYFFIILAFAIVYLVWVAIPILIILYGASII